jgi:acyl carrier protein
MLLEITAQLEKRYTVSIEDSEMTKVRTLIDLHTLLSAKVAARQDM